MSKTRPVDASIQAVSPLSILFSGGAAGVASGALTGCWSAKSGAVLTRRRARVANNENVFFKEVSPCSGKPARKTSGERQGTLIWKKAWSNQCANGIERLA